MQFGRRAADAGDGRRLPGMQLLNGPNKEAPSFCTSPRTCRGALPHLDVMDPNHRHALQIGDGQLMERVYGEGEIRVNSMHQWRSDDVAPGFAVTARCPDGVVEAIESTTEWVAFGTQFHRSASGLGARSPHFEEFVGRNPPGEVVEMRMVA